MGLENLILFNIRRKRKNLGQGTTSLCTHEGYTLYKLDPTQKTELYVHSNTSAVTAAL